MRNQVVSHEDWLKARLDLLAAEKEFTRQRDALTRRRLGWSFPWVSSNGSDFNYDYRVSFTPAERKRARPVTIPIPATPAASTW